MIFRKVIFNTKVNRSNFIRNKQKYRIVNQRNFYSVPNGPDDPNYFIIFVTACSSYFTLKFIYKK